MLSNEVAMVPQQFLPVESDRYSDNPMTVCLIPGRGHVAEHMKYGVQAVQAMGHYAVAAELPSAYDRPTLDDYIACVLKTVSDYEDVVMVGWSRGDHWGSHAVSYMPPGQLLAKIGICTGGPYGILSTLPRHGVDLSKCFIDDGTGIEIPNKAEIDDIMYGRVASRALRDESLDLLVPVQVLTDDMKIAPERVEDVSYFTVLGEFDDIIDDETAGEVAGILKSQPSWIPTGHVPHLENPFRMASEIVTLGRLAQQRRTND